MTVLSWALAAAVGAIGAVAAAGAYTEAHRAPDQP
jgi:hypothetical protein